MGQHSHKSSPNDGRLSPGRRRWTAIAAGAAVVAAASTTAWAAVGNDSPTPSSPKPTTGALTQTPNPAAAGGVQTGHPASPAKPADPGSDPAAAAAPNAARPGTSSSPAGTSASNPGSTGTATPSPGQAATSAHVATSAPKAPAASRPSATATPEPRAAEPVKAKVTKPKVRVLSSGTCGASYYGEPQMTASGERFNPSAMTAAHKTLPLGSKVRVINPRSGESVTVRINDRGPYVGGRCLDLSRAAFAAIGSLNAGVMTVRYQVLAR